MTMIDIPSWVPVSVASRIRILNQKEWTDEERIILERLATHVNMKDVWKTLLSKNRKNDDLYIYPATPEGQWLPTDLAQNEAMSQLFHYIFYTMKDKRSVSKIEETESARVELLNRASMLREISNDLNEANRLTRPVQEIDALLRVAGWFEEHAKQLRDQHDPLTVKNHRGDPRVRGAQIECAGHLLRLFGQPLHGTAATLVSVGLNTTTSPRASRSAFSS